MAGPLVCVTLKQLAGQTRYELDGVEVEDGSHLEVLLADGLWLPGVYATWGPHDGDVTFLLELDGGVPAGARVPCDATWRWSPASAH